jgi:hypothetical protein
MENKEINKIASELEELEDRVLNLELSENVCSDRYSSHSKKNISKALASAQSEFKIAEKNQKNPFFKSTYADWKAIVSASRPALTKYELSIQQKTITKDGQDYLRTELVHSSGEWTASEAKINPPKLDIQALSSYRTYLKRMEYSTLLGVVTGDEDDDGESAVAYTRSSSYIKNEECINQDQYEQLEQELLNHVDITEMVMKALNIKSLHEMPKSKFLASINRIREIKLSKEKR